MATVPVETAPSVAPSAAPAPLQQISAPAAAFGATVVGEGASELGKAAESGANAVFDYATKVQNLHNEAAANGQSADAITALLTRRAAFEQNKGINAAPALPQYLQDSDDIAAKYREGLSQPAQIMYDAQVRRQLGYAKSGAIDFAHTQTIGAQVQSATSGANAQLLVAQDDPLNPAKLGTAIAAIEQSQKIIGGIQGWDADTISVKQQDAVGQALAKQTQLIMSTDPIQGPKAAQQFYEAHRDEMGPYGSQIGQELIQRLKPIQAADIADGAFARTVTSSLGTSPGFQDYVSKLGPSEGSTRNPASTADGYYQFTEDTWLATMKQLPPALTAGKTTAQILDMRHDPVVANQALQVFTQGNAQYLSAHQQQASEANLAIAHQFSAQVATAILSSNGNAPMSSVVPVHTLAINGIDPNETTANFVRSRNAKYGTDILDFSPPSPGQQLVNLKGSLSSGLADIAANTPDPEMRNLAEARFMANANRTEVGLQGQVFQAQQSIYSTLNKGIAEGAITDYNSFLAQPGAAAAVANLDPQERALLPQQIAKALNLALDTLAPAQTQSWVAATGLKAVDPYAFVQAKADPAWTPDLKAKFAGMQRAALAGIETNVEKETTKSLNNKAFADNLAASGIAPGTPGYEHFVGVYQLELDEYASANKGAFPSTTEKIVMANKLLAQSGGGFFGAGGTHAFEPPPQWLAEKRAAYPQASERDLARAYTLSQEAKHGH